MERSGLGLYLRAGVWLLALGSFFFLSYNAANNYAAGLQHVPSIMFSWERHLPFLAWTIIPYWSSDALYSLSFALFRNPRALDRHAFRLLAIQILSVLCFVLFPLRLVYVRPEVDGLAGWFFGVLASFDKPFNQLPSLHVSLAVILWLAYRRVLSGWPRRIAAAWFLLIGISAWTTYQHQFIDLPMGLWAGLIVAAAIPERTFAHAQSLKLALLYLIPSVALTAAAFAWQGPWWIALWPAFALSMVACAYWTGDPAWLSKHNGRIAFWMWPYTVCAWINSRCWTLGQAPWHLLLDGVWIGRAPAAASGFATIIDLTAEMPVRAHHHIPILDLTVPNADQTRQAVAAVIHAERPTLICCALGYSRGATIAAAWLVAAGHAASAEAAVAMVRQARPQVVLRKESVELVRDCIRPAA
jgi:hypothetical protein